MSKKEKTKKKFLKKYDDVDSYHDDVDSDINNYTDDEEFSLVSENDNDDDSDDNNEKCNKNKNNKELIQKPKPRKPNKKGISKSIKV